jgi:hypothetical protein
MCGPRKLSTVSVQGSPRLRQSLAALGFGYGLNEKPGGQAKRKTGAG